MKCSHCKKVKSCSEYNKCITTRDKLHHQCKTCRSKLRLKYKNKLQTERGESRVWDYKRSNKQAG